MLRYQIINSNERNAGHHAGLQLVYSFIEMVLAVLGVKDRHRKEKETGGVSRKDRQSS